MPRLARCDTDPVAWQNQTAHKLPCPSMVNLGKVAVAGIGAKLLTGSVLGFVLVFLLIYWLIG